MYAFIKGRLHDIYEDTIVIENNNIGYEIRIPMSTGTVLPNIGEELCLYTYLQHIENAMTLYGFFSRDDLEVFKKLITVSGIGPKGALGVLSAMTADELRFAIMAGDDKAIAKAPGIGKKTASKLILELKDKISMKDILSTNKINTTNNDISQTIIESKDIISEAVQALTVLGYGSSEALQVVKKITITNATTVEDIIKHALKELATF